jgi:hypothetical protein
VKGQVARRSAGVQGGERRIVRHQFPGLGVQPVDHDLVDALVADEQPLAGRVERHEVGVRPLLGRPRPGALVLAQVGGRLEPPIRVDRQNGHRTVLVVGDEQVAASRVGTEVAGLAAVGALPAEERQIARVLVDLVRRDRPWPLAFEDPALADGEQEALSRIERQEGRIDVRDRM